MSINDAASSEQFAQSKQPIVPVMKNFSAEQEDLLRQYLFTNPHGKDSFLYPQSLVCGEELSPLLSAYSRTHIPFQDRVLMFLDSEKTEQTQYFLRIIPEMMQQTRNEDGSLKVSKRTADFNSEWVLAHGHNSIKEETQLFGHSEQISDITVKKITGHPLAKPQVKSTRYLSYGKVLDQPDVDIDNLDSLVGGKTGDRFAQHIAMLNSAYLRTTETLANRLLDGEKTKEIVRFLSQDSVCDARVAAQLQKKNLVDKSSEELMQIAAAEKKKYLDSLQDSAVRKELGKFVLDYTRVYLPAVTKTSVGFSLDARTLEEIITDMISSPRKEDQARGYSMWNEAKKVAPTLLGEKSHIKVNEWQQYNESLRATMRSRFGHIPIYNHGVAQIFTHNDVDMYSDKWNAACVLFGMLDSSVLDIYARLSSADVYYVLDSVHAHRGNFDVLHPSIAHGGLVTEFTMPYHGYRDLFRHRNGARSVQLLTRALGYETPLIFDTYGLSPEFHKIMDENEKIVAQAQKISRSAAEKLVVFGANCRAMHTWQPNQIGYVTRLRSNPRTANFSYLHAVREQSQALHEIMPITATYLRTNRMEYPQDMWKRGYDMIDTKVRDCSK